MFDGLKRQVRAWAMATESLSDFDKRLDALAAGISGGVSFSDTSALNLAAVFNAATIRTQYVAMLPLITYYRDARDRKERYKTSPVYYLLHDRPNPLMTSYSWRSTMELHALFYGGGFSRIERDIVGRPIWLWLMDARMMRSELRDGGKRLVWLYRQKNGTDIEYADSDIIHIPGLAFDGVNGEGVIKLAAKSFWLSAATEDFGKRFFENGMNAGGIFQHPGKLSDQAFDNLRKTIDERSKPGQAHKAMILEEGLTWNKITFSPEEAQFLGTRQFQDVEIARWFNLPLRYLKMADASGLRNVEQIAIEMVQTTMLPRYVAWEQELNNKLFGAGANRFAEFNVDGLLRGDSKTRADVSNIMRQAGALNADEWRARENMNPIGGEEGTVYWGQPNLAAAKPEETDDDETEEETEEETTEPTEADNEQE